MFSGNSLQTAMLVFTGLSALGAVGAAVAALFAAKETRDAVRMQVWVDFAKRDAAPEIGRATKLLWEFAAQNGINVEDVGKRFWRLKEEDPEEWNRIDEARRVVHKYFLHLMQAKQAKLFTDKEILISTYKNQLATVVKILKPIEDGNVGAISSGPVFAAYKRLYDNYDNLYRKHFGQDPR